MEKRPNYQRLDQRLTDRLRDIPGGRRVVYRYANVAAACGIDLRRGQQRHGDNTNGFGGSSFETGLRGLVSVLPVKDPMTS